MTNLLAMQKPTLSLVSRRFGHLIIPLGCGFGVFGTLSYSGSANAAILTVSQSTPLGTHDLFLTFSVGDQCRLSPEAPEGQATSASLDAPGQTSSVPPPAGSKPRGKLDKLGPSPATSTTAEPSSASSAPQTDRGVVTTPGTRGSAQPSEGRIAPAEALSFGEPASDASPDRNPDQLLSLFQGAGAQSQSVGDELDLISGRRQALTDLRTLQDQLNDMQRPVANAVVRYSTQSDKLDIRQVEASQDLFFAEGRDTLRFGFQALKYDNPSTQPVNQYAAGIIGSAKFNDVAAVTGSFWLNQINYDRSRNTQLTYDVFLTLQPSDIVRIDIDTNRRLFDNIQSLQLGATAQSYGGSIDVMPIDRLRLTARTFYATYSDGNKRWSEELMGVWRVKSNNPILEIGLRASAFQFSRLLNNGYFNPKHYESGEALFQLRSELTSKLTVELTGSGGAESSEPGSVKPLFKGSIQAVYKVYKGWSVDGEVAQFSSRASSSSGFARTSFTLGLHYRF